MVNNYFKDMLLKMITGCIVVMIFYFILSIVMGFFVSLLWNLLMPVLFGFCTISYFQGFLLMILCCILFSRININYNK